MHRPTGRAGYFWTMGSILRDGAQRFLIWRGVISTQSRETCFLEAYARGLRYRSSWRARCGTWRSSRRFSAQPNLINGKSRPCRVCKLSAFLRLTAQTEAIVFIRTLNSLDNPMTTKPIPDGYHTVTPYLIVDGGQKLIDFLKQAFGAKETFSMKGQGETIAHAEVQIGDSIIMISDAASEWKARSSMLYLYVEDVDAVYKRALEAGATSVREPANQFYGDRSAGVTDP